MPVLARNDVLLRDWSYSARGTGMLGPSDSSDSGSDVTGASPGAGNALADDIDGSADDTVINYAAPQWRPTV